MPLRLISTNEHASTYRIPLHGCQEGLLGMRKAGAWFGGHYHKGAQPNKSPEKLVLLQGEVKIFLRDVHSLEESEHTLMGPQEIHIKPNVWHKLLAISDVLFLEMNSLEEHVADTYYIAPE